MNLPNTPNLQSVPRKLSNFSQLEPKNSKIYLSFYPFVLVQRAARSVRNEMWVEKCAEVGCRPGWDGISLAWQISIHLSSLTGWILDVSPSSFRFSIFLHKICRLLFFFYLWRSPRTEDLETSNFLSYIYHSCF